MASHLDIVFWRPSAEPKQIAYMDGAALWIGCIRLLLWARHQKHRNKRHVLTLQNNSSALEVCLGQYGSTEEGV